MSTNCLVYTNLSDGLQRLIHFVPQLVNCGFNRIIFLHSVPVWDERRVVGIDEEKLQEARELLAPALKSVPSQAEVKIEVISGQSLDAIRRLIESYEINLILMATPPKTAIESRLCGDNVLDLAKATSQPLMIFRPQLLSTYTSEELELRCKHLLREILVPYDDGSSARYFIERLKNYIANNSKGTLQRVHLLWVVEETRVSELMSSRLQAAEQRLAEVKAELTALGLDAIAEVRQGEPILEILDVALKSNISAIAIASNHRNSLMEWAVPSFANEILSHSWFPVLYFSSYR